MKLCVGISTYNRCGLLPKAIQSALEQDYPDKSVYVFDDGSTDETPALTHLFPKVRWKRADVNGGLISARNYLMSTADSDLYCTLDDDAWFIERNVLSEAVKVFDQKPTLAVLALEILSPARPRPRTGAMSKTHLFVGCGAILRLSAVREVGYFARTPGLYGAEEVDLSMRLLDRGYEVLWTPDLAVWHDHSLVARNREAQHSSGVCNELAVALRRFPMPEVAAIVPGKVVSHIVFAIRNGLVGPCLRGLWMFVRHLHIILRLREPVRRSTMRDFFRRAEGNRGATT